MSVIDYVREFTNDRGNGRLPELGIILAFFAVLPLFAVSGYLLRVFTIVVVFALFTVALNIVFGHTDQLFLFVGGLAGMGAYTTVIAANSIGTTPWITLPLGVAIAGMIGGTVSYVAAKRKFTVILIAIFTLALQLSIMELLTGARGLTGGSVGMPVQGVGIQSDIQFYYLFVAVLIGFLVVYARMIDSRYGLAFETIRQEELAAEATGVDVVRYKVIAGTVGSLMIGFAGAVYAFWAGYISPGTFSFLSIDVLVLIMLTLGGMRTLSGPVIGAIAVVSIEEILASYPQWRLVIFGTLLIVLYLNFRQGIVPNVKSAYRERFASESG
ncbi:branched-chain amino acid ABC transporter permease [Halalkaliarchaeum sp. AArc-GB]|uniref:branched-chain amino acid ABC transporter permease n=1 Tax=Halalkaliarchaeum sp. AArc-GB TaxID=3074078 RepID=UPI00286036DD|nr:branched-chain amino acid ABC transporter permease [Halalkaliarchaeum sp. AArc-GB]MDR5673857.1 branched-chain amino acid ABC transporter permease [Halalkaliarchaeum sp. AArc-GB]